MISIVPAVDILETFATVNFMCVHERTLQELFSMVNEPLSLVVKNVSENSPYATIVCLSGAETANYLQFLDYRLGDIYPKIDVEIEIKIEVTIFKLRLQFFKLRLHFLTSTKSVNKICKIEVKMTSSLRRQQN